MADGRLTEETVVGRLREVTVEKVVGNWDVDEIVDVLANRVVDVENSSIVLVCVDVNSIVLVSGAGPPQISSTGQQPPIPFDAITQLYLGNDTVMINQQTRHKGASYPPGQ